MNIACMHATLYAQATLGSQIGPASSPDSMDILISLV